MGGKRTGGCDICVARACTEARHTNDTHGFPQTTLFVVSKSRLIALSARHLLGTEKKSTPHKGKGPPHAKVPDRNPVILMPEKGTTQFFGCVVQAAGTGGPKPAMFGKKCFSSCASSCPNLRPTKHDLRKRESNINLETLFKFCVQFPENALLQS